MPDIRLKNLTKRYGKIVANNNVNLTIRDGEYISIIGPSGCGKTTLIKSIAGIAKPDEGEIYIDDELVNDVPIEERGVGYVFQNIALFPHMNVWDNVTYGPRVKGLPQKATRSLALEMLEMIKVTTRSDSFPYELSGGTQQKIAVARALMAKADLLLLDEPLGALDVKVRAVLRYELRRLVKELKLTALHVTHDQEEAMSISDRVIVMRRGCIIEAGKPIELYTHPKNLFTANFVGEANLLTGVVVQTSDGGSLVEIGKEFQLRTCSKDETVGKRVIVAFRPEFISINQREVHNTFLGTVIDILYSGNFVRYKAELSNGKIIVFKKTSHFIGPELSLGDAVTIYVSPKNVLTYPYPEEGLYTELKLE